MTVGRVVWGVPDLGPAVTRRRILELATRAGSRGLIFSGAAGCGKTVAMAQAAARGEHPVAWVWGCRDESSRSLCKLMREVSSFGERPMNGLPIVALDGVELSSGESLDEVITALVLAAGDCGVVFAVSTRHRVLAPRPDVLVVDAESLAFTASEMSGLRTLLGLESGSPDEDHAALGISHGNPAAVTLLLDASHPSSVRVSFLDALLEAVAPDQDAPLLLAALMTSTTTADLERLSLPRMRDALLRLSDDLPLVGRAKLSGGPETFHVHPLLADRVISRHTPQSAFDKGIELPEVLNLLSEHGRWPEALRLAQWLSPLEMVADWLDDQGQHAIAAMGHREVLNVISEMPTSHLLARPRLMLWWATALHEVGLIDDAIAKCTVGIMLADHDGDADTAMRLRTLHLRCLLVHGDMDRCLSVLQTVSERVNPRVPIDVQCELLMEAGFAYLVLGNLEQGHASLEAAHKLSLTSGASNFIAMRCERLTSSLNAYLTGNWMESARHLARLSRATVDGFSERAALRGSLAVALVETGRLSRARQQLQGVLGESGSIDAAYMPFLACIEAAEGAHERALATLRTALDSAHSCGDDGDIHATEVLASLLERVAGHEQQALDMAEQSYESLCSSDYLGFRDLAACEVGASLLFMGDLHAPKTWLECDESAWPNPYHALRAAMVLAECDRREGDLDSAIGRLSEFADHIRSENSNWQMAMYIRTFPHLLGMLAAAAGAKHLPAHMLRMILPENADRCLRAAQPLMEPAEFDLLGRRLLGDEQFAEFLERKGRPICRVRLFGGLEVTSGDRHVSERDWSKRKARLLFAMLVARRGHDVSRDTILEHLWPEMDEERGKNNFYVAWSSMKSALMSPDSRAEKCPYIENVRGRCRVVRDNVRSDVDEFEDLLAKARTAEAEDRPDDAREAYKALIGVYRGDLLPGDLYDDWFAALRDKYRFEFLEAVLRASRLCEPSEALVFIRRGLDIDPFREDLYQAALRCQIDSGRRSAAIETFIQCKTQLADELGLDPSAETIALYQQVLVMEETSQYDPYDLDDAFAEDR